MTQRFTPLTLIAFVALPTFAFAQNTAPDVAKMANALNITQAEAQSCLPASLAAGKRPSRSERTATMACFKTANPNLTDGEIRSILRDMRP
ncbi:hypothetical protein [uncultured Tateyamaria sp.]|uniref:hypothetical protein n=1 Tax=Tateyamaria sp. TaxID=1929288 RepID=UPI00261FACDA|nr:hypothetical protein [uncultured Tateyamaria sp.]